MNFNTLRKNPGSTAMAVACTGFAVLDAATGFWWGTVVSAGCAVYWWLIAFDEEK